MDIVLMASVIYLLQQVLQIQRNFQQSGPDWPFPFFGDDNVGGQVEFWKGVVEGVS